MATSAPKFGQGGWPERLTVSLVAICVLGGCQRVAPKGQVLATVGNKDITLQDVRAEGRAEGVPQNAGHAADAALLQRVVDRELLVQSAHAQKLDQTPEEPSDLERAQKVRLAEKAAKRLVAGEAPPSDAQAQAFIAAHPYAFIKRERISARTLTLAGAPSLLAQLRTFKNYNDAHLFLKRLGVAAAAGSGDMDTARLPASVAARLAATPAGTLLITQPPGRIQLAEIESHTAVVLGATEQLALAKRALASEAASRRVNVELLKLRTDTPISYQPGYAPDRSPSTSSQPPQKPAD